MNNTLGMCGIERYPRSQCRDRAIALIAGRPSEGQFTQSLTFQVLHRDERTRRLLADPVNSADIGMIQGRCSPRFPSEAFKGQLIPDNIISPELQGDKPSKPGVFGFVDDTHATSTELLQDAVVRNRLARWKRGGHSAQHLNRTNALAIRSNLLLGL
jgi:hypothetical protein